jgi:triosephosphate isomerase (TIM)
MRRKIIAGNWKMNNDLKETQNLISKLSAGLAGDSYNCDVIICPPFTSLSEAYSLLKGTKIKLGAQNMYFESPGAFTGEISASMLLSVGCEFVILGHSERRVIFGESDQVINLKIKKAVSNGLKPIFCVGELLEQREAGETQEVIKKQVNAGLIEISSEEIGKIIIAYEPVWAIGTGKTASPAQAQSVHELIRSLIKSKYGESVASSIIIQYGGSVKADNASELLSQKDIDGALVGGACLKAESFIDIIKAA